MVHRPTSTRQNSNRPNSTPASRTGDLWRGVWSAVALVVLLFGVPLAFAWFGGWPLPRVMPNFESLRTGLTRDLEISHVIRALLVVCWLAWAALAWAILTELAALRSGRTPRQRRSLAPFQAFAARLVSGVTLLVSVPGVAGALPAPTLPRAEAMMTSSRVVMQQPESATSATAAASTATWSLEKATISPPVSSPVASATADVSPRSIVVAPGDSLHKLAEQHLGDAMRWREIWDLNAGTTMADGSTFTRPEIIRPGWELALPVPASSMRHDIAGRPEAAAPTARVERFDSLSSIAADRLGSAERWPEVFEVNRDRVANPDHIEPGWVLDLPVEDGGAAPAAEPEADIDSPTPPTLEQAPLPPTSSPTPTAPTPPPPAAVLPAPIASPAAIPPSPAIRTTPATAPATVAPAPTVAVAPAPASATSRESRTAGVLGIAGATFLATGVATVVAGRRRHRLRSMGPEQAEPRGSDAAAAMARVVAAAADHESTDRLRAVLRVLAADAALDLSGTGTVVFDAGAVDTPPVAPRPLAFLLDGDGGLEVIFDQPPRSVPSSFVAGSTEYALRLPAGAVLDSDDATAVDVDPCPALVHVGVTTDDGDRRQVFVDLEAVGTLTVTSNVAGVAIARAMVASLAMSPFGDQCAVVPTGFSVGALSDERRIEVAASFAEAVTVARDNARIWASDARVLPPFARRFDMSDEPAPVTVVVAPNATVADQATVLSAVRGAALVAGDNVPATWRVHVVDDGGAPVWELAPLGLRVVPVGVTEGDAADLALVLADAAQPPITIAALPDRSTGDDSDDDGDDDSDRELAAADDAWRLLVRVLGPVDVVDREGVAVPFERSKALELVVWLAEHRRSALRSTARSALWHTDVRDATFLNVVSDARRSMDKLVPLLDEEQWISKFGENLVLHEDLSSDADLVRRRLDRARSQSAAATVRTLQPALALLRGMPLAGTDYHWAEAEAVSSSLVHQATSVATLLGRAALAVGDADLTLLAAAVGLGILPGHEELVGLRMEAHASMGNLAGVRAEFAAYERAMHADPWFDGELSPSVVACRARLLSSSDGPSVAA